MAANLFSSSPMAFAFSRPSTSPKVMKSGCFCVVRNDGSTPTQAPKGGGAAAKVVQIKCSFTNKIYEDRSKGIACYIDEMGEIVCEGYDEGPRTDSRFLSSHLRDVGDVEVDVIQLLERSWLQSSNGIPYKTAAEYSSDEFIN